MPSRGPNVGQAAYLHFLPPLMRSFSGGEGRLVRGAGAVGLRWHWAGRFYSLCPHILGSLMFWALASHCRCPWVTPLAAVPPRSRVGCLARSWVVNLSPLRPPCGCTGRSRDSRSRGVQRPRGCSDRSRDPRSRGVQRARTPVRCSRSPSEGVLCAKSTCN